MQQFLCRGVGLTLSTHFIEAFTKKYFLTGADFKQPKNRKSLLEKLWIF